MPLLAPVAQKLGIDLIWFGVLLCVNMQTSFMHPPFGFALFYLRGIAPKEVKSSDIYWGAIPWVVLQLIMVAILIAFPQLVTAFLDKGNNVDPDSITIEIPQSDFQQENERRPTPRIAAEIKKPRRGGACCCARSSLRLLLCRRLGRGLADLAS